MKKFLLAIALFGFVGTIQAQRKPFVAPALPAKPIAKPAINTDAKSKIVKTSPFAAPSRDYVMLQAGYESWANVPDSIQFKGINRAFNAYLCYDFPITKSNFSFALGAGIASSNVYLKNQQIALTDTVTFIKFQPESVDFKKYKFNVTYLEAPFELRYFSDNLNRNKGFKGAIGLKVGTILSSHTKSKQTISKSVVEKVSTTRYLEKYRYSATLRLGYGNFSIYGQYALSNLFKANNGPENIKPFQIGICLSGL